MTLHQLVKQGFRDSQGVATCDWLEIETETSLDLKITGIFVRNWQPTTFISLSYS